MITSGQGAAPDPAKLVDGKLLVAIAEFSLVLHAKCK